jgi:hypothetical protein
MLGHPDHCHLVDTLQASTQVCGVAAQGPRAPQGCCPCSHPAGLLQERGPAGQLLQAGRLVQGCATQGSSRGRHLRLLEAAGAQGAAATRPSQACRAQAHCCHPPAATRGHPHAGALLVLLYQVWQLGLLLLLLLLLVFQLQGRAWHLGRPQAHAHPSPPQCTLLPASQRGGCPTSAAAHGWARRLLQLLVAPEGP